MSQPDNDKDKPLPDDTLFVWVTGVVSAITAVVWVSWLWLMLT